MNEIQILWGMVQLHLQEWQPAWLPSLSSWDQTPEQGLLEDSEEPNQKSESIGVTTRIIKCQIP